MLNGLQAVTSTASWMLMRHQRMPNPIVIHRGFCVRAAIANPPKASAEGEPGCRKKMEEPLLVGSARRAAGGR
jgi:hypothetical protein